MSRRSVSPCCSWWMKVKVSWFVMKHLNPTRCLGDEALIIVTTLTRDVPFSLCCCCFLFLHCFSHFRCLCFPSWQPNVSELLIISMTFQALALSAELRDAALALQLLVLSGGRNALCKRPNVLSSPGATGIRTHNRPVQRKSPNFSPPSHSVHELSPFSQENFN